MGTLNLTNVQHNINAIELNFNYIADTLQDLAHYVAELKCQNNDNIKISTHLFLVADYANLLAEKINHMKLDIQTEIQRTVSNEVGV